MSVGLLETLKLTSATKGITATEVQSKLDPGMNFHPTAFNNRLTDLFDFGLLRRERKGRTWVYFRATNPTK
jgi:hypothetical protein